MPETLESATQKLEKLIRDRAETNSHMTMNIFAEALVDLLDEKDKEIEKLRQESLNVLQYQVSLFGDKDVSNIPGLVLL